MKTFEEFVASREQMDPSARKMTEHQWEQAYAAYRSSRERVRKSSSSTESKRESGQSKRKKSSSTHSRGTRPTPPVTGAIALRQQVRAQSAYSDFRVMVDLLAWVVIGVIIVNALLKMSMMVSVYVTMSALLEGALGVLVAFVSKHLIQVVIDIADIALLERQKDHKSPSVKSDEPES